MIPLKIFRESVDAILPSKTRINDAGYDLYSIMDVSIEPGERKLVPIGLRIICPDGYFYTFAPRSGLAFKNNIIPSHKNIMDSNYTGNCDVLMLNRSDKQYIIKKGDRFCQLIIHQIPEITIEDIDELDFELYAYQKQERGDSGFGSSGK